ncbi:hypothetical protein V9L05_06885 [Bernardetia sp. Wsw4-3y2]|uniref:hypothetical protein n=1 Tax=Bernardetia sp. Wsw4-3y2 TaxID=3127471 RepID=UPI0030D4A603
MKIYILSLILCLFSCNPKPISENQVIENQKIKVVENKLPNFNAYTSVQLDSFFQIYRDSLLDIVQKNKFDKDTTISNEFSQVMYGIAANDFPAFVFVENKYCDIGGDDFECKSFLYAEKNEVFELAETFTNKNSTLYAWYDSRIECRDVDFDNKLDIIIKRPWHMVSRSIAEYYLFANRNFKNSDMIFSTDTLGINSENKTIVSFLDGGMCCPHNKTISKWQSDSLVEIKHLGKTYNHQEGGEILEEFIIKNGKEIKVKSQKLKQDEAEQYFENYK